MLGVNATETTSSRSGRRGMPVRDAGAGCGWGRLRCSFSARTALARQGLHRPLPAGELMPCLSIAGPAVLQPDQQHPFPTSSRSGQKRLFDPGCDLPVELQGCSPVFQAPGEAVCPCSERQSPGARGVGHRRIAAIALTRPWTVGLSVGSLGGFTQNSDPFPLQMDAAPRISSEPH